MPKRRRKRTDVERVSVELKALTRGATYWKKQHFDINSENVVILIQGIGSTWYSPKYRKLKERLKKISSTYVFSYAGVYQPKYAKENTLQQAQAVHQSQHLRDLLHVFKDAKRIFLVGYSLGGVLIAYFLVDMLANTQMRDKLTLEILEKVTCTILMGAPIEPFSLLGKVGRSADILNMLLQGYKPEATNAITLYRYFPRTVQIIGELDDSANTERSGYYENAPQPAYPARPILVPRTNHYDLLSNTHSIDAVTTIIQKCIESSFDGFAKEYRDGKLFDWQSV